MVHGFSTTSTEKNPFTKENFYASDSYDFSSPLTSLRAGELYYIHSTDTPLVFSVQGGLRMTEMCGNGKVEGDETCDSVPGCTSNCTNKLGYFCDSQSNACSFLIPIFNCPPCEAPPEGCEGTGTGQCGCGPYLNPDGSECTGLHSAAPVCGNGDPSLMGADTEEGEECDDGNLISGDGCSGSDHPNGGCTIEFCGDGYVDKDGILTGDGDRIWQEECDDGGYCFADGVAPTPENAMKDESGNPIRCTTMGWSEQTQCGEGADCIITSNDGCSTDCTLEGSTQATHTVCKDASCIEVSGLGDDECTTVTDCIQPEPVTCNPQQNLAVLFTGKTSLTQLLSVAKDFADRLAAKQSIAEDDVNCDGTVDGVPSSDQQPFGDFRIIVDRATSLMLE